MKRFLPDGLHQGAFQQQIAKAVEQIEYEYDAGPLRDAAMVLLRAEVANAKATGVRLCEQRATLCRAEADGWRAIKDP